MVEWKTIGEICIPLKKEIIKQSDLKEDGKYPVVNSGVSLYGYYNDYNNEGNAFTLASRGEYAGFISYLNDSFWAGGLCYPYRSKDETQYITKYIYGYLKRRERFIMDTLVMRGGIPALNKADVDKIKIPIPSLSEQTRIVGILDTFTASIDNLKEQITQRRKQYEHYRDQLLDLEGKEGVKRVILKDVCEVINGRAYRQPELLSEGKYRVLRVGNFFSNDSWYYSDLELEEKYYCENGDLLYAWSASFGPHIWDEEKVIYHYHIWKMNCGEGFNKKYMYYWLQSEDMRRQAFTNLHGATMAHLTKALMESLMVPVPSIEEQSRIVSILDTFEASITNLEAQLKEREKQYEYYRNKLLTFE